MKSKTELTSISKLLSLVLRHDPQRIGLQLDESGWASVSDLLARVEAAGRDITHEQLKEVVSSSDKKRFAFSEDGTRIRANQGHSIEIDLGLACQAPPDALYHGTATRFLESILRTGLEKRERHHVHLTSDIAVARSVGLRYGKLVLLQVDAGRMCGDGHLFFRSDNGVWLTDTVPPRYLMVLE
jgi:putative RNA 2'-phosphotransferase